MTKTICPICYQELDKVLRPDFLLCPTCQVAVRTSGILVKEPDCLNIYNSDWVEGHSNNPIAHDIAKHIAQVVSKVLPEGEGNSVIDIGCGSGMLVDRLAKIGYQATGLDWSAPAIEYARNHYQGEYILADVEQGLDTGSKFNCAVASHILEHLENPHEFLQSVKRIVELDGYLVIAVPNLDWWNPNSIYRSVSTVFDPEHVVGYSPKGVGRLLEANGYRVEFMTTRTHRLAILTAVGINVYRKLFGGKGNVGVGTGMKSGYVKATSDGVVAKVLAWGMKPWNRLSERGLKGMELIVIAKKGE